MAHYVLGLRPDEVVPAGSKVLLNDNEIGTVVSVVDDSVTIGDETVNWKHCNMDICNEDTVKALETMWRIGILIVAARTGTNPALCLYLEDQLTS